jgi:hypothetical protein
VARREGILDYARRKSDCAVRRFGVTIVVGAVADGHLIGDILAFGMTLSMAIMMLIIRQHHETPMIPAACRSAQLCRLVVWPFVVKLASIMLVARRLGRSQ